MIQATQLAEAYGAPMEIQSYGFLINQVTNLHVMLGLPGSQWLEVPFPENPHEFGVLNPVTANSSGLVHAPSGLGLGLNWNTISSSGLTR